MSSSIKSYLKFFVKVYLISPVRSWLLLLFGKPVNHSGWENRILIVHLEGLGDSIALTSVLKHYREDFPNQEIYLALNQSSGFDDPSIFGGVVKRILKVDYRRFVINPLYGLRLINELRQIGFKKVITHDPSLAEVSGKFIVLGVGGEELIGYEGAFFQRVTPFDKNMELGVAYVRKNLLPRFTKVVGSADSGFDFRVQRPLNYIRHFIKSYESVAENMHADYSPKLYVPSASETSVLQLLRQNGVSPGKYCLLSLSTSTPGREWPAERFAETLLKIKSRGIPIVIAGGKRDAILAPRFEKIYGSDFSNLAAKTSVSEYIALVQNSLFSLSNETAQVHIAIALKKPSFTILGGGHLGLLSLYGYRGINRWLYKKDAACLYDNWRCIHSVRPNEPTPCIAAISVPEVLSGLQSLVDYIESETNYPRETFRIEFV